MFPGFSTGMGYLRHDGRTMTANMLLLLPGGDGFVVLFVA